MSEGALVVGGKLAAVQAALDLAESGIRVILTERSPFLGGRVAERFSLPPPAREEHRLPSVPQMLQIVKHPNITLMTDSQVTSIRGTREEFRVRIRREPRYVDVERCTGCGDCAAVCPMPLPHPLVPPCGTNGGAKAQQAVLEHRAAYKLDTQSVPNAYAIEKVGTAPCRNACPIDQRAQGYIALIREGRFADAYRAIREENPFPSICGRVCNHRCEDACNRGKVDAPVNIMALKRFVADWAAEHPEEIAAAMSEVRAQPKEPALFRADRDGSQPPESQKQVAIVGAGPAGLTAALDLVRMGYGATVFEAQPVAGGMIRLGVPDHRLPPEVVQREIDDIVAEGVELKLNHRVEDMGALLEDGFDAIFIAVGAHSGVQLPIPGADLPDVHLATDYLRSAGLRNPLDVAERRMLVLGGGNVALDVAQTAVRTGAAWVGLSCLESREAMPAHDWEVQDAEEEGVQVFPSRTFREVTSEGGRVTGVRCAQVVFRGFRDGRADFDEIPGTEEVIPADMVVFAIGQWPDLTGTPEGIEKYRGRLLVADKETQATNIPDVAAGGDVVTGTSFIVDAIVAGHRAAYSLDTYLRTGVPDAWQATNPSQQVVEFTRQEADARLTAYPTISRAPRTELPKLPAEQRKSSFIETYSGLTEEQAIAEAQRCLFCGACSECLACVRACEAKAIDHYQAPEQVDLEVGAVIWADEIDPAPLLSGREIYRVPENDPLAASAVAARAMADLADYRRKTPLPLLYPMVAETPRVGVFICRCGGQIGSVLDVDALVGEAGFLPDVIYAQDLSFGCQSEAAAAIKQAMDDHSLNRVVLAGCSCCSLDQVCDSCTYQRVRCKTNLLDAPLDLRKLPVEFVNIREQCAWPHRDSPQLGTAKAGRLIAAAVAKAGLMGSTLGAPRAVAELDSRVLVAGDGEPAAVCAQALRAQDFAVTWSRDLPTALTGSLGRFSVTLGGRDVDSRGWEPCHDQPDWEPEPEVSAGAVVLAPADEAQLARFTPQVGVFFCSPNGDAGQMGAAVAAKVGAILGGGRVLADRNVAQVDPTRCRACGTCESVCEFLAIKVVEMRGLPAVDAHAWQRLPAARGREPSLEQRYWEPSLEQRDTGIRLVARVEPALCRGCGTCAAHCPSSAITAGYSTDAQIEAMLAALLAR